MRNTLESNSILAPIKNNEGNPIVVGLGASAGGLEAITSFLMNLPIHNQLAIVIVQHLSPHKESALVELLQLHTNIPVTQVSKRIKIQPNHIYIAPFNKNLGIDEGYFYLFDRQQSDDAQLPINFFFDSLAENKKERSVAVILSGMGCDGCLGARSIKEHGGICFVQTPETAKFSSMPQHAIDAGVASVVAPVEHLPDRILMWTESLDHQRDAQSPKLTTYQVLFDSILKLLFKRTGNDFSQYKKNCITRRLKHRMSVLRIDDVKTYYRYLVDSPSEQDLFVNELLIGVTLFFRDQPAWNALKNEGFPLLINEFPKGKEFRAWVPACSTGEEAYSLAILFKEFLRKNNLEERYSLRIFATDLNQNAINLARKGFFKYNALNNLSKAHLKMFFTEDVGGYRIHKEIRDMVIFAKQNIISDPPFINLDILVCRNLLIYFNRELQYKLMSLFRFSIRPNGILLLGTAEGVVVTNHHFEVLNRKWKLYKQVANISNKENTYFPIKQVTHLSTFTMENKMTQPTFNLKAMAYQSLLGNLMHAALLITPEGDVLFVDGDTGLYLDPALGRDRWNIYVMAHEVFRDYLIKGINQSLNQDEVVIFKGIASGDRHVNLTIQRISKGTLHGNLIVIFYDTEELVFADALNVVGGQNLEVNGQLKKLKNENIKLKEEIKAEREELHSSNEELQSVNEELNISQEELQSSNEELLSLNHDLESKLENLVLVNNDMNNILNSTEIISVFLDNNLHIRRFTNQATQIFKLIPSDMGRSLSDIANSLDYPKLYDDVKSVGETGVSSEKVALSNRQQWFKVRIMPYRKSNNMVDGVVITCIDITDLKNLTMQLDKLKHQLDSRP